MNFIPFKCDKAPFVPMESDFVVREIDQEEGEGMVDKIVALDSWLFFIS